MDAIQYQRRVAMEAPKSSLLYDCCKAFWVGGTICTVGEGVRTLYTVWGMNEKATASWVCITMIFFGALLTGLGVYDKIGKYAGAGSVVPITGFANGISSPAMEFRAEGLVTGVGAKMFVIAGPVIVYGVCASVIVGVIYYVIGLWA